MLLFAGSLRRVPLPGESGRFSRGLESPSSIWRRKGSAHGQLNETGRPPFNPGDLLRLYLYGYLNRVRSNRGLEREAGRDLEVIWLLRKLRPDFKTIGDFRRENADGD